MNNPPKIETLKEHIDSYIRHVLDLHGGSVGSAARTLRIGRATLYRWVNGGQSTALGANRDSLGVQERRALRAEILKEVLTMWSSTHNNGQFTRWLTDELTEAGGKP